MLNKQKKTYHKIAWIAEMTALQIVGEGKGNAFIMEKLVREGCLIFVLIFASNIKGKPLCL